MRTGVWRWAVTVGVLLKCSTPSPEEVTRAATPGPSQPGPGDDWQRQVVSRIATSEYRIRKTEPGWEASNRAQGLRAQWDEAGVSVRPRTHDGAPVRLRVTSWGTQSLEPLGPAAFREGGPRADGAVDVDGAPLQRVVATHGPVTEWWENRAEGLEQGFTVERPPALAGGPPRLVLSVEGPRPRVTE